jgi:hypothetical protein
MTLIRLIRAMPDLAVSASPRVPGDEFALRRGPSPGNFVRPHRCSGLEDRGSEDASSPSKLVLVPIGAGEWA